MVRYYKCQARGCDKKVAPSYLAQHWMRNHFEKMYIIVEYETQAVFALNTETGETKEIEPSNAI